MVQRGARLDIKDYYGRTPLEAARDLGHPELVAPILAAAGDTGGSDVLGKKKIYRSGDRQSGDYVRRDKSPAAPPSLPPSPPGTSESSQAAAQDGHALVASARRACAWPLARQQTLPMHYEPPEAHSIA